MDSPYDDLPQIPDSYREKLNLLKEQLNLFMATIKEAIAGPLSGEDSPEFQMLSKAMGDLEEVAPVALEAFAEVNESHRKVAEECLKAVEDFPAKMQEMNEQLAKELAPFAADLFVAKSPEPVPLFKDILNIEKNLEELELILRPEETDAPRALPNAGATGNIWENWQSARDSKVNKSKENQKTLDYVFPLELLNSLGLEAEKEKSIPTGGNIWENWK